MAFTFNRYTRGKPLATLTAKVKQRTWHGLSYEAARAADLDGPEDLKRWLSGTIELTESQIRSLARYYQMEQK